MSPCRGAVAKMPLKPFFARKPFFPAVQEEGGELLYKAQEMVRLSLAIDSWVYTPPFVGGFSQAADSWFGSH